MTTATASAPPSIRARLTRTIMIWSLLWCVSVGFAVWLAVTHEVDELLDDTLQSSTELLAALMPPTEGAAGAAQARPAPRDPISLERFAWQMVSADGSVLTRSAMAPAAAWHGTPVAGFSDSPGWRIFGLPFAQDGRVLYAAQSSAERHEARAGVGMSAALAALVVGLLGYLWFHLRVRTELQPLQRLSQRLALLEIDRPLDESLLGQAEREELQSVHRAIAGLAARLSVRIANEQAFTAHAAHALRTPLAGIDAQLAVALLECPPSMRSRLLRIRGAAARLNTVVAALLGLFRAGGQTHRSTVDVSALLAGLPAVGIDVQVAPGTQVDADPDLLAAALLNLLDNSQRHGARRAWVGPTADGGLRMQDDGPGVTAIQRQSLQAALDDQAYENTTGLGLMLADRVARAHGGRLRLTQSEGGFAAELELGRAPERAA